MHWVGDVDTSYLVVVYTYYVQQLCREKILSELVVKSGHCKNEVVEEEGSISRVQLNGW